MQIIKKIIIIIINNNYQIMITNNYRNANVNNKNTDENKQSIRGVYAEDSEEN